MIISSAFDYWEAAKRRLPRIMFDYIDGGDFAKRTLRINSPDLAAITPDAASRKALEHC